MKHDLPYKILVIEDNSGDFLLVKEYLYDQIKSPEVHHAGTYKEACSELNTNENFDIILLDLTLPDNDGEDLINDIVKLSKRAPVIILTGYSNLEFCIKSVSFGISDYLLKDELTSASLFKSITYNIEKQKNLLKIEESERRYSDLFHLSPLPMYLYDVETLKFLDVNSAMIENYGYSEEEFLNMKITEIRPKSTMKRFKKAIKFIENQDSYRFKEKFIHEKKNGDLIHVEILSKSIEFQDKNAKVILANDVTERILYFDALQKQNEKLKEIAWIQSHKVRSPVSRILGMVDLIKHKICSEKENKVLIDEIQHSVKELDKIIRDISGKTEEVKLNNNQLKDDEEH
ncbi:MAG: response regulator [Psychroflexus sp.]